MNEIVIGFMASHGGSNMQAIIDAIKAGKLKAKAGAVISNNSGSGAIERAKTECIPYYHISSKTHPIPEEHDLAIINTFRENDVNIIVLAGYMRILSPSVIRAFNGRVLNIHPALLPKFGGEGMWGMNVHKAVIEASEALSGPTVHLVNEEYDKGRILGQIKVEVLKTDTPESLAEKVLEKEHELYPLILQKITDNLIKI